MEIKREYSIELTLGEKIRLVREMVAKHPDIVAIAQLYPYGDCPFPEHCKEFPCSRLMCNADCLSNGYPYRMS